MIRRMALLVCFVAGGCAGTLGDDSRTQAVCVPETTRGCACPSGEQSLQTCLDDGLAWGSCACGDSREGDPESGTLGCADVDACMLACAQGDTACYDNCYAQGTAVAQGQVDALLSCIDSAYMDSCQNACGSESQDCWDCLDQACAAEYGSCYGTDGVGPDTTGSQSCSEVAQCMSSCQQNDTACYDGCYAQGTAAAQQQMDALDSCTNSAYAGSCQSLCGSATQECWDCLQQACSTQYATCYGSDGTGPETTGTQSCSAVDECFFNCAQNDTACYDSCYAQGTATAQSLIDALYTCVDSAWVGSCQSVCTSESQECWSCVDQACAAQLDACHGTGTGTGTQSCAQIEQCMYNCAQNDTACYDSCQAQGTAAAQSQSDALYTCIDNAWVGSCQSVCTSESQECWSCVDQACAAEYYACYGY